jgi:hypothetical protein
MPIDMEIWGDAMLPVSCPKCCNITHEKILTMKETEICVCSECGNKISITEMELETLASMQKCVCGAIEE